MTDTVPPCDALQQAHVGGDDPRGALILCRTYLPAVVCQPRCTTAAGAWHGQFLDGSAKVEAIFVCARAVICGCESGRLGGAWHCWIGCGPSKRGVGFAKVEAVLVHARGQCGCGCGCGVSCGGGGDIDVHHVTELFRYTPNCVC